MSGEPPKIPTTIMRRPTFLRVYSSDATEKADEATPINASAVELGLGVGSFVSMGSTTLLPETSDVAAAAALAAGFVLLLLPIQVHPPGGKQGLTAVLGSLAWAGVRRLLCRPPEKSPERRVLINNR